MPEIAVIIPHYNDVTRLMRCLAALWPQMAGEAGAGVEVVVVDNGSSESLARVEGGWPDLRIVTEAQKGAACARNRGVAETTAAVLVFLDCDCLPATDWLATVRTLTKTLAPQRATHPAGTPENRADLIGGSISVFDETPPPRTGAQAFEAVFAFDNGAYVTQKGFSVTANLVTRRDVFDAVGPFTPGLSEDLDWCHRARAMGYRLIYAPELQVAHPSRGDWGALRRKWLRLTDEAYGLQGTGLRARLIWAGKALAMPASILAHAPRLLASPRLRGGPERLAGLATLARLRLVRSGWMLAQVLRRQG